MGDLREGKENYYGVSSVSWQLTRHSDISLEETPFSRGRQGDGGVGATVGASVEVMGVSFHGIYLLCVVSRSRVMGWKTAREEGGLEPCRDRRRIDILDTEWQSWGRVA